MNAIKIIAENISTDGRAVAPHEGRRRPIETDPAAARGWLEKFAALPAFEAEEADTRLYLIAGLHHFVVRFAGGRLILEEGGTFNAASVDDIMAWLASRPATPATVKSDSPFAAKPPVDRTRDHGNQRRP